MPSNYFTRDATNQFVISSNGNSRIYFDSNFGGAPLQWKYPKSGTLKQIVNTPAGLGFQAVVDEGQDITQASANGVTTFPIARTGIDTGATLAYKNYWARESTAGYPTTNLDQYIVQGFFPDFWASLPSGNADDAIPPNSSNNVQSGWVTGYTSPSITNYPYNINTWGTPVYFSPYGSPLVTSGILMEGNQAVNISAAWNTRLRSIPYGRVAFRVKVSLSNASDDAYGGIMFRKDVPTTGSINMDAAYNAKGYSLNVNRNGDIGLTYFSGGGAATTIWSYAGTTATMNSVRNSYGIQLELRTNNGNPNYLEIWADQVNLTPSGFTIPSAYRFSNWQNARHLGLIAYTTNSPQRISGQPNFVRFGDREVCNVGTQTTITAAPQSDGSMITTILVGPAGGVTEKRILYTATQVAYLMAGTGYSYGTILSENPVGTLYQGPYTTQDIGGHIVGGSSPINAAMYGGESSGLIGLCCVPDTITISGGVSVPMQPHTFCSPQAKSGNPHQCTYVHINGLPLITGGTTGPWQMDSISIKARWYPYKV
jgi:hypothetical protein